MKRTSSELPKEGKASVPKKTRYPKREAKTGRTAKTQVESEDPEMFVEEERDEIYDLIEGLRQVTTEGFKALTKEIQKLVKTTEDTRKDVESITKKLHTLTTHVDDLKDSEEEHFAVIEVQFQLFSNDNRNRRRRI